MSFFKKKKPYLMGEEIAKTINAMCADQPVIIKKSVIKPTKCKSCLTIYQADHKHIKSERDIVCIHPKFNLFSECPICKNLNEVKFEEAEDERL